MCSYSDSVEILEVRDIGITVGACSVLRILIPNAPVNFKGFPRAFYNARICPGKLSD